MEDNPTFYFLKFCLLERGKKKKKKNQRIAITIKLTNSLLKWNSKHNLSPANGYSSTYETSKPLFCTKEKRKTHKLKTQNFHHYYKQEIAQNFVIQEYIRTRRVKTTRYAVGFHYIAHSCPTSTNLTLLCIRLTKNIDT